MERNINERPQLTDDELDTVTGGVAWFVVMAVGAAAGAAGVKLGDWISKKLDA